MEKVIPDSVLETCTCSICHKYLTVAPITDHPQGGNVCGRCQHIMKKSASLFQCESLPEHQPSLSLPYGIFGYINHLFPCINRFEGCDQLLSFGEIDDHEQNCPSMKSKCLNCNFEGTGSQQMSHIKHNHLGNFFEKAKFSLNISKIKNQTTNLVQTENFSFLVNVKSDMIRKQVEVQVKKLTKVDNSYLLCFLKGRNEEVFVYTTLKKEEPKSETFFFHDIKIDYPLDKVTINCECLNYK